MPHSQHILANVLRRRRVHQHIQIVSKEIDARRSLIPLKLTLEEMPVNNPETGKKQTVYVLNLRAGVTMAQLATAAREQARAYMLEAPDWEAEIERVENELWGAGGPEATAPAGVRPEEGGDA